MKTIIQSLRLSIILTFSVVFLSNTHSTAQGEGSPVSIGTYRQLYSQVLNEDRTLLINLPEGYDETTIRYPVLYVLYGGQVRGYFAESVHIVDRLHGAGLIPPLIIVGVMNVDRYRDNLPVNRNGEKGGAENFLRFFTDELLPFIDESYRTKDFRILLGPQAGAAFSLYTLMEQPGLFRVNIVTNPFWNRSSRDYLLARAADFFEGEESLKNYLFITCNTSDDDEDTMKYLDRFTSVVKEGTIMDFALILNPREEKEAFGLIPSPGLREGLEAYFKDYRLPEDTDVHGLEDLKQYYKDLSDEYGYEIDIPEVTLIRQGDRLQQRGQNETAREFYEYVTEHYPQNLDGYHRLAELQRRTGDYDRSIENYEKFLARRQEPFIEQRLISLRRYVNESAAHVIEQSIINSGIEAGVAKYRDIRSDDQNQLYFSENEFNSMGYGLIARGMIGAAVEVFKMNVEVNPQSANAYDSLGEAYMLGGDVELAIENYRRSLELDPDNTNAREMLEKLESED